MRGIYCCTKKLLARASTLFVLAEILMRVPEENLYKLECEETIC